MDITNLLNGIRVRPNGSGPIYLQIANILAAKIQDCTLPAGNKLPPERELARLLGVSRTTAIHVYKLLEERGLVLTKVGSGTYVADFAGEMDDQQPALPWEQLFTPQYKSPLSSVIRTLISAPATGDSISLSAGLPDPALYPVAVMEKLLAENSGFWDPAGLTYLPTEGYLPLRRSLAAWHCQQGAPTTPDHILVVSGSQQGLYLIAKTFVEPRDYVVVESPTYMGAIQILHSSGARILPLPLSGSLDLLEDYLIRYRPKLLYTIPTFHNPSGRVMPADYRRQLISLAARHRLIIVEDDPYGQLYYGHQPPAPLRDSDTYGGVIYLGTLSKILFPGLRIGWVTAAPQVINRLAQEKQYVDLHSNNLAQKMVHLFLAENLLPGHLSAVRKEYKNRRDAMIGAIRQYCSKNLDFDIPGGGFYLWCNVRSSASPDELLHQAAIAGVSFVPGEAFYSNGSGNRQQIRLCFASHNSSRLAEGIRRLGRVFASSASSTAPPPPPAAGLPII